MLRPGYKINYGEGRERTAMKWLPIIPSSVTLTSQNIIFPWLENSIPYSPILTMLMFLEKENFAEPIY